MKIDTTQFKIFSRGKGHLRVAITSLFIMILAVSFIATLSYTYYQTSHAALRSAWQSMKSTNNSKYRDILRYLGTASRKTTSMAWALKDTVRVRDDREHLFLIAVGQLRAQREIFSISMGDPTGSVLSVGKTFDDPKYRLNPSKSLPPEVKYRVHFVDISGYQKSEYYQYLDENLKLVDQEVVSPDRINYDARTKSWYMLADRAKKNSWSDVNIYSNGQFGISNVEPVLDDRGNIRVVISTSIALSLHDGITSRLDAGQQGIAFVVDREGQLIIYPDLEKMIRCENTAGAQRQCRLNHVNEIDNSALADAFERYRKKSDLSDSSNIPRKLNYRDYMPAIKRLTPDVRDTFN